MHVLHQHPGGQIYIRTVIFHWNFTKCLYFCWFDPGVARAAADLYLKTVRQVCFEKADLYQPVNVCIDNALILRYIV